MKNNEQKGFKSPSFDTKNDTPKKTVYDGLNITKRGLDIAVAILSLALITILMIAVLK